VDWVKLSARYYLDAAVAALPDDGAEVMFTRGLAYCGDQETGGFVPAGMLPALCRRRRYEAAAGALVAAGLWRPARGGYQVTRWEEWQEELDAIAQRRSADRDRKRRERERAKAQRGQHPQDLSRDTSRDSDTARSINNSQVSGMSRDVSADSHAPIERREKRDNPPHPPGAPPPRKRGTRIPGDFTVTPDMVTWARSEVPGVDGRAETAKFMDYWRAATGRGATKLDWTATWRNWMRRAAEQQPPRGRHVRSGQTEDLFDRAYQRAQAREDNDPDGNRHPDQIRQGMLPPAGD
jgi:hypothetical protein